MNLEHETGTKTPAEIDEEEQENERLHTAFTSSLSSNTRAWFFPRHQPLLAHHPFSSFPKSCHVQNKTSAQAGQRRMRYFLFGSALSFSLKKLRPGTKPPSLLCCASVLASPVLGALSPLDFSWHQLLTGSQARPWALEALSCLCNL